MVSEWQQVGEYNQRDKKRKCLCFQCSVYQVPNRTRKHFFVDIPYWKFITTRIKRKIIKAEKKTNYPQENGARMICDFLLLTMDAKENGATFSKFLQ